MPNMRMNGARLPPLLKLGERVALLLGVSASVPLTSATDFRPGVCGIRGSSSVLVDAESTYPAGALAFFCLFRDRPLGMRTRRRLNDGERGMGGGVAVTPARVAETSGAAVLAAVPVPADSGAVGFVVCTADVDADGAFVGAALTSVVASSGFLPFLSLSARGIAISTMNRDQVSQQQSPRADKRCSSTIVHETGTPATASMRFATKVEARCRVNFHLNAFSRASLLHDASQCAIHVVARGMG